MGLVVADDRRGLARRAGDGLHTGVRTYMPKLSSWTSEDEVARILWEAGAFFQTREERLIAARKIVAALSKRFEKKKKKL